MDTNDDLHPQMGHLDQSMFADYMKNSLALILPSLTEGLPRVVIEAQMLGKPVIASRVGGIPEIIADGETGFLVEPQDWQALARAMLKIIENPALAERMGSAAQTRACARRLIVKIIILHTMLWYSKSACMLLKTMASKKNLLLFNLMTDRNDPILGFTTECITALAPFFEKIFVVTMTKGVVEVPHNVHVYSVGKELGFSEFRRIIRFYQIVRKIISTERIDVCFVH